MDVNSTGVFPQIMTGLGIAIVIFVIYLFLEKMYAAYLGYSTSRVAIVDSTCPSGDPRYFRQDPTNRANTAILTLSDNQLTGIEFSYTTFIYVSPNTDDGTNGWKAVFYKGYENSPMPLVAPGVFVSGTNTANKSPTLRVVMNTYDSWFNVIDIEQIPFNKWFHLSIILRANNIELYVNGNMSNRGSFNGTLPYQNYQTLTVFPKVLTDVTLFDNTNNQYTSMGIPPGENMTVTGPFSGYVSNLYYFSYALSYSEIQAMMNMGPSTATCASAQNMDPAYLIDSWWTQSRG